MDQTDLELLKLLQQNCRVTLSQLSEQLRLSRPSVSERMRRLEERQEG